MFLGRNGVSASSTYWAERYEKIHKNLVKRTKQLRRAKQELTNRVAERKLVEETLRQAEQRYCSLFENPVVGIFQTTPSGRYQACNQTLARIYGYQSAEQLLENLTDIGRQLYVDSERRCEFIERLHSCDSVSEFESQVYRRDGGIIWISEDAWAVCDEDGMLLYYEGFVTDITKRKLAEEALQKSEAQVRSQSKELELALNKLQRTQIQLIQNEKMSTLGQLLASIAHEIKNPVNFVCNNLIPASQYAQDLLALLALYAKYYPQPAPEIQNYAEAIELDFLIKDFSKILSSMQMGTDRIRQIVQSLQNFSRLDEVITLADLHEEIDSTLLILHNRLKPKGDNKPGITVIKEYGDLPLVECYPGLLNQVFMNLLCNAIDALEELNVERFESSGNNMPPLTPCIWIRTEVIGSGLKDGTNSAGLVVVRIIDNGFGMTEEIRKQIFEPFFTTKPAGKGTGLGLSISYQIVVEKHGGQLRCISAPEQGTEFALELPI